MNRPGRMISNIQVLRGIAALAVVFWHTNFEIFGRHAGYGGVPLFFVISGFVLTYISRSETHGFLAKRMVRIVPIYWLATVFAAVWFNFGFANPVYVYPLWAKWAAGEPIQIVNWFAVHWQALRTPDNAWLFLRSMLFLPSADLPLLGVGWTLNLEIGFYLLFAAALAISRRWGPVICAIVLVGLAAFAGSGACGATCNVYGLVQIVYFALGIACHYLWRWLEEKAVRAPRPALVWSSVVLVAWPVAEFVAGSSPTLKLLVPAVVAPAVVLAALTLHSIGRRSADRWLLALGASSYSLYLTHSFVIEPFRAAGQTLPAIAPATMLGMSICMVASVVLGRIVFRWVERPMLGALRARISGTDDLPDSIRTIR